MTRNLTRWLLAAALTIATLAGTPVPARAADHAETRRLLEQYLSHAGPGAALYAGGGDAAWTVSAGSATIAATRPITATDHFRVGSQTKTVTAAVVMQLFDEGLVELDAPIERYLPGVVTGDHYDGGVITVRQILQHTSGITRDTTGARAEPDGTYTLAELVRAAMTRPPLFAPGADFGYSNVNYLIAGMLIEHLTGQTVQAAIETRIIAPLGLSDTYFPAPGDRSLPSPYVPGYQGGRLGPFFFWTESTFNLELSSVGTAGAMTSTLVDMAAFQQALAEGEVVSREALAQMRTMFPATPEMEWDGYGLGFMHLSLSCGGDAWGHAGDITTGHSSLTMATDDGRFASLVTNTVVASTAEPTRSDLIDAALCEGVPA